MPIEGRQRAGYAGTTLQLMAAAFGAYFCMYAFRKPITAASFENATFASGVDLKTAVLVGQIVGYAISKYMGILVCTTLSARRRAPTLVGFVVFAELALCLFAVVDGGWQVLAMFFNGIPLGMVWGLVVRYLEGRRSSEILLAALSVSFIVSSGVVKDVGLWLMSAFAVPEPWMPAATGALFLLPFVLCVQMLERAAAPDRDDVAARVQRRRMTGKDRRAFLKRYGLGLAPLMLAFFFLTAYRDFRDNYGIEIFSEFGYEGTPALFTRTELPAGLFVMLALALIVLIRDNRRGLVVTYGLMAVGLVTVFVSTLMFRSGRIDGLEWMVVVGIGSYLAYVPVGAVLFDRLTAAGGAAGTAVFGIYIADAIGYTGSVGVQLFKDLGAADMTRGAFFTEFSLYLSVGGLACLVASAAWVLASLPSGAASPDPDAVPVGEVG